MTQKKGLIIMLVILGVFSSLILVIWVQSRYRGDEILDKAMAANEETQRKLAILKLFKKEIDDTIKRGN